MNRLPLSVQPSPVVAELRPYSPGRLDYEIDLWLDANESLEPAPGLGAAWETLADLHRYPSVVDLESRIANDHGVDPAAVLVTAGADDALERAIRSVCSPGRRAVLTRPSFTMLQRYARLTGADVLEIPWWAGEYPVESVCDQADESTAVVTVVSPNNPTGATISAQGLGELAQRLPKVLVLLDHAYVEFAADDLTPLALEHPNVVVFRTFSKARGAAGLRVGYAVGDPRVIGWMRCVGQPYSVSRPSIAAAAAMLDITGTESKRIELVRDQRARLDGLLRELGAETLPSEANFVLVRPDDAAALRRDLASLGIAVRGFSGDAELGPWLRVTVPGVPAAWRRLENALHTALRPEALLFDLDGVLADVSGSYRRAITETAARFGVQLTDDDIAGAKAEGNANNDWKLTQRLLAAKGVRRSLDEVTSVFEELYQGQSDAPGLRRHERLMMSAERLQALGTAHRLAVVTGRPRSDALRFLDEHGLRGLFSTVVTMEDGPAKPDPFPVRVALERLGVQRAWMFGDTPDDLRAARAAGVLPVGVVAPGEDVATTRPVLEAAGAARILESLDELEEMLP